MTGLMLAAVLAAAVTGYAAGRSRPARRLIDWAQDTVTRQTVRAPLFWLAAPVIVLALAAVWTLHPRRSAANRRSWRTEHPTRTAETDTTRD